MYSAKKTIITLIVLVGCTTENRGSDASADQDIDVLEYGDSSGEILEMPEELHVQDEEELLDIFDVSYDEECLDIGDEADGENLCEYLAEAVRAIRPEDRIFFYGERRVVSVPEARGGDARLIWNVDAGVLRPDEGADVEFEAPGSRTDVNVQVVIEAPVCGSAANLVFKVRSDGEAAEMHACLSEILEWPPGVVPFAGVESTLVSERFAVVLCMGGDVRESLDCLPVSMRVRNVGPPVDRVVETRPSCDFEVRLDGIPPPNNLATCDGLAVECDPPTGSEQWATGTTHESGNFYIRFGMSEYSCGYLVLFPEGAGEYTAHGMYHGRLADGTTIVSDALDLTFTVHP
jgi:hypothetical protein